jgi:hypothetical protein
MTETKRHAHALQDHFKKGNTFYPPFTYDEGVSRFEHVDWRGNFLPELIWIAVLIADHGFDQAKKLACDIALSADQAETSSSKYDFGIVSSYGLLCPEAKQRLVQRLTAHGEFDKIRRSLSSLIVLYPACPFSFLTQGFHEKVDYKESHKKISGILEELLYRGEKLPTLTQGIHYDIEVCTSRLEFVPPLKPQDTDILKEYPDTPESKIVASYIRAGTQMMNMSIQNKRWINYFWHRGHQLGRCIIPPDDDLLIGSIPQEVTLYHLECFRKYFERANELWEKIEESYKIDFYQPLKDEILLGLACRIYRLTIHVISFLPNWTEDISEIFIRMVLESYIYYRWLKKNGKKEDYEKFYNYGLGQQKLRLEHIKFYLREQGLSEDEVKQRALDIDYLKKHKMPEFVPVNVGNPLDKNLRIIADEADCRELYALMYSPASSAIHGMYDSLDLFYLRRCINPFHGRHKVPYHWSKCPVSTYGSFNCIGITDWILSDLLSSIKQELPSQMPGELFIQEILNKKGLDDFSKREDVQKWIEKAEKFGRGSGAFEKIDNSNV